MVNRKLLRTAALLSWAALYATAPVQAGVDTYTVDAGHSDVGFRIRHLVSKVSGNFDRFAGTIKMDTAAIENSSVEFTIESASVNTRHEKRDGHLRTADFFDVATYPTITFKSSKVKALGGDRYEVTGTFTMRGVAKELTLPVAFLGTVKDPWGNTKAGFSINLELNRKDYGVNWNAALDQGGVMLSDEVSVEINLEAKLVVPEAPKAQ